ncbi:hypothetical protein [Tsuneonella aeria]|uniref:hypothetical protein n=1 Tax=Tsuneonella aeria TaxID=1837929 RepID=UPI00301CD54F
MFTQLNPPIPLHVLDKGDGLAIGLIDYGPEHNLIWITAIDATGEIWCAPNPKVRMQANWSMGRGKSEAVEASRRRMASTKTGLGVDPASEPCTGCAEGLTVRG